jgi:hypothetical protein
MRVLIAGHALTDIGGVQTYERDLATWLLARGHSPVVYGTDLGAAAAEMTRRTIPVTDDLRTVAAPIDVIHGDSALEPMTALLHFPATPAIFVSHGWGSRAEITPHFPRILHYVAVDDTCADRLLLLEGIPPEKVSVILNAVDVNAFRQRGPLPAKPRRAVVFGNVAHELTFLPAIREACRRASIDVDVIGALAGTSAVQPEAILGEYDIAFAKAKCAIEAMACGLAVILCDAPGIGGMVCSNDLDRLRRLNFGIRTLRVPLSADTIQEELAKYDPEDARRVSDRIRNVAPSDALYESLLAVYESVIAAHASSGVKDDWLLESRAASVFLNGLARKERERERDITTVAKASHRLLQMPVIGRASGRVLRWLTQRPR